MPRRDRRGCHIASEFQHSAEGEADAFASASAEDVTFTPLARYTGTWWVLHTKPRNEKALAGELDRLGVTCFLPLVRYRRTYGGRVKPVDIPLFPSYVFLCGSEEDRLAALRTNRIAHVLEVADQSRLRHDLSHIHRVVSGDVPVDLYPRLKTGARCRVISGTLRGLEGVVLRRRGPWKVYVGVEFLGQSAELEIDSALLEVLD